jgi:hypothetical protein
VQSKLLQSGNLLRVVVRMIAKKMKVAGMTAAIMRKMKAKTINFH